MKKLLMCAAFPIATTVAAAQNLPAAPVYENSIQVTGKAEREVVPDEIYIRIVLDENSPTKKMAIDKQEADLVKALRGLGIDTERDLAVTDLAGGYKTYALKKNQGTVVKKYELKVGDAAVLANVYRALDAVNITDVGVVRIYHSRMKELSNELKVEAVKDARVQADVLAGALGQKAGRAVMVSEYGYMGIEGVEVMPNAAVLRTKSIADAGYGGGADDTSIEFRKLKLTYSVQVKFVLV